MTQADWQGRLHALAQEVWAVLAQRGGVYGDPREAFRDYADLFSTLLKTHVTPAQAALLMAALKLGRLAYAPEHRDSWLDLAGYALIGALSASEQEERDDVE